MEIEIYLSWGRNQNMLKVELYIDGYRPEKAVVEEFPRGKIADFVENFYGNLELKGIGDISIHVKNKGVEKKLFQDIEDQISRKLKPRRMTLN